MGEGASPGATIFYGCSTAAFRSAFRDARDGYFSADLRVERLDVVASVCDAVIVRCVDASYLWQTGWWLDWPPCPLRAYSSVHDISIIDCQKLFEAVALHILSPLSTTQHIYIYKYIICARSLLPATQEFLLQ